MCIFGSMSELVRRFVLEAFLAQIWLYELLSVQVAEGRYRLKADEKNLQPPASQ